MGRSFALFSRYLDVDLTYNSKERLDFEAYSAVVKREVEKDCFPLTDRSPGSGIYFEIAFSERLGCIQRFVDSMIFFKSGMDWFGITVRAQGTFFECEEF